MRPIIVALGTLALVTACSSGSPVPSTSPSDNGATYTYASTSYGVTPGLGGQPLPIPTSRSTEQSVITTNAGFGGMHGLIQIARTPIGSARKLTSYEYYAMPNDNGVSQFEEVAARGVTDFASGKERFVENGTLTFTKPFVVVELPFSAGRTWSRSAAYDGTTDETSQHPANLHLSGRTVFNADGSHSSAGSGEELGKVFNGSTVLASDGAYHDQFRLGSCRQKLDVGVPVMKSGAYVIPYATSAKGCSSAPTPVATTLPDWYPGGALPPSPLRSANASDMGAAAIPASCGVAPSIATRGEKIVVTVTEFNPLGNVNHSVETSYYATGIGLVCSEVETISQEYALQPPVYEGRGVIHTVRRLIGYTKGSTVGAPLGFGGVLQPRAVIVGVGGARVP
ncbi:MAG TPA: hypothetical protein VGG89_07490 [Candidatus Baltobacteraceae bacterium]|jgi:hypothetical protein